MHNEIKIGKKYLGQNHPIFVTAEIGVTCNYDMKITKELIDNIESWSYDRLDEVNRIAPIIKEKMKKNGII